MLSAYTTKLSELNIILASDSVVRKQLLEQLGLRFKVHSSGFNERSKDGRTLDEAIKYALDTARSKVEAVIENGKVDSKLIIGADTVMFFEDRMIGKPRNRDDAIATLSDLNGRDHLVITGVCCAHNTTHFIQFHELTRVKMARLSPEMIESYVDTGEPMDKAGSYAIQGKGCSIVEMIEGDYYNVVGLPLNSLAKHLIDLFQFK
ncbi:hypothetical protein ACOME3_005768 [Neoechinorhynchus agilis]